MRLLHFADAWHISLYIDDFVAVFPLYVGGNLKNFEMLEMCDLQKFWE